MVYLISCSFSISDFQIYIYIFSKSGGLCYKNKDKDYFIYFLCYLILLYFRN